jgi:two-component system nitrogen regulation response regulator GlnG
LTDGLNVWLVDDDASIRWVLERALRGSGMLTRAFESADPAIEALRLGEPDVLLTDIRMPGRSGLSLLEEVRREHPLLPVIVMTAFSDLDSAVAAYQGGAFEYLPKPFDIDTAVDLVRRAASRAEGPGPAGPAERIPELIGSAPAMQEVFRAVGRLARSSLTVLVTGESGTGKELVARALHRHSPRARSPFIALNTSAFTADLLESELFGHEKGAFTGADRERRGRFEQADGGTLFLDEIGDMSRALQTRLLRVLAEGEFYRVGGNVPIKVDVRVIAATHQRLQDRVRSGEFREDLLHRLNVITIELPPLRQRREDVPALLEHYLAEAARELGVPPKRLAREAQALLVAADWPGNVRQLVNVCRRLTVGAAGPAIESRDVLLALEGAATAGLPTWQSALASWASEQLATGGPPLLDIAQPEFERVLIGAALARSAGRRQEAARLLGLGRNTLARKIRDLALDAPPEPEVPHDSATDTQRADRSGGAS